MSSFTKMTDRCRQCKNGLMIEYPLDLENSLYCIKLKSVILEPDDLLVECIDFKPIENKEPEDRKCNNCKKAVTIYNSEGVNDYKFCIPWGVTIVKPYAINKCKEFES